MTVSDVPYMEEGVKSIYESWVEEYPDSTLGIRDAVTSYLREHGYDGLYYVMGECACRLDDDLIYCAPTDITMDMVDDMLYDCAPGYLFDCNSCSDKLVEDVCPLSDDMDWTMGVPGFCTPIL